MRGFSIALVLVSSLCSVSALAEAPSRDTVRTMLSSFEHGPGVLQWRALGPETVAVLVSLYNDGSEPGFVRMRAVAASAHFPIPATRTFLRAVASTPGQSDLFVRQAVASLGRAFGDDALDDVRPYLTHSDYVVREAAVRALGSMNAPLARRLLEARFPLESDDSVRSAFGDVLAR